MAAGQYDPSRIEVKNMKKILINNDPERLGHVSIKREPGFDIDGADRTYLPKESPGSKKNKRKSTEPRKRTDFSVKRLCSSVAGSEGDDSVRSDTDSPPSVLDDRSPPMPGCHGAMHPMGVLIPPVYHPSQVLLDSGQEPSRPVSSSSWTESHINLSPADSKRHRKNYKNMTRERRIEANARERTRVHTISAAFESLRRAVPSYSYNQKLSKLAILKIAASYILALSRLADVDDSMEGKYPSFEECVDQCTQTIQTEGRIRKRQ